MKKLYSVISPVSQQLHRIKLQHSHDSVVSIDFDQVFGPTIDQYKKFAFGRFFWFVVDFVNWKHKWGGGEVESMTPLKMKDLTEAEPQALFDITHPGDAPEVFAFSNCWVEFYRTLPAEKKPHVKVTLYFRILNAEQHYRWVMVQYPHSIFDGEGRFVYGLVLVTEISHIKKEGRPMMNILDTSDGNHQQFFCANEKEMAVQHNLLSLTMREVDILKRLARGDSSKEIAAELGLAVKTVDNHRQNMLHKTNSRSSAELVSYGIQMGYL